MGLCMLQGIGSDSVTYVAAACGYAAYVQCSTAYAVQSVFLSCLILLTAAHTNLQMQP